MGLARYRTYRGENLVCLHLLQVQELTAADKLAEQLHAKHGELKFAVESRTQELAELQQKYADEAAAKEATLKQLDSARDQAAAQHDSDAACIEQLKHQIEDLTSALETTKQDLINSEQAKQAVDEELTQQQQAYEDKQQAHAAVSEHLTKLSSAHEALVSEKVRLHVWLQCHSLLHAPLICMVLFCLPMQVVHIAKYQPWLAVRR